MEFIAQPARRTRPQEGRYVRFESRADIVTGRRAGPLGALCRRSGVQPFPSAAVSSFSEVTVILNALNPLQLDSVRDKN
jgi:hypothetical protein